MNEWQLSRNRTTKKVSIVIPRFISRIKQGVSEKDGVGYIKQIVSTLILENITEHFTLNDFWNKIILFTHYNCLYPPFPVPTPNKEDSSKVFLLSYCNYQAP